MPWWVFAITAIVAFIGGGIHRSHDDHQAKLRDAEGQAPQ
jgi:hypothetical protein